MYIAGGMHAPLPLLCVGAHTIGTIAKAAAASAPSLKPCGPLLHAVSFIAVPPCYHYLQLFYTYGQDLDELDAALEARIAQRKGLTPSVVPGTAKKPDSPPPQAQRLLRRRSSNGGSFAGGRGPGAGQQQGGEAAGGSGGGGYTGVASKLGGKAQPGSTARMGMTFVQFLQLCQVGAWGRVARVVVVWAGWEGCSLGQCTSSTASTLVVP